MKSKEFLRERSHLLGVSSHLQSYYDELAAFLRLECGMEPEGIGQLWWLQIESARLNWCQGALYARHGADHPFLRSDFLQVEARRLQAMEFACRTYSGDIKVS